MNRTKIEYLNFTWNPIVGCSGVGCAVRDKCWARAMAKRWRNKCVEHYVFKPHLHKERLYQPLHRKKPAIIGVCFMGELFDVEVPREWQQRVFDIIHGAYWHSFLCLTKQPQNVDNSLVNEPNFWLGVSVNKQNDIWRIQKLTESSTPNKFVSFEPLYEKISCGFSEIDWIIIGAQTRPLLIPNYDWVRDLIEMANIYNVPVFLKNNLQPEWNTKHFQEFPMEKVKP